MGTLIFPSWEIQKFNRVCCQYSLKKQAAVIVKILSIRIVERKKKRGMGERSKEPSADSMLKLVQSPCEYWAWRYSLCYGPDGHL